MKKMMMTLAAVLCCAMTMTVFTACGSDDDDSKNPAEDTTPKQVAMNFVLYNTADMLNYCNIEISYDNGLGNAGALDHTYTFTFDAKGNMTSK
jgi:hypothetical protein